MEKINLSNVSIVCIDDRNLQPAIESIEKSSEEIIFGEKILITNESLCSKDYSNLLKKKGITIKFIPKITSISDFSFFCLNNLSDYISTEYCLLVQWDGWIINPSKWNSSFLEYDYIGATWPHHKVNRVGNGGFSLRSKKLLDATKSLTGEKKPSLDNLIEDDYICREHKEQLEYKFKIKFAPENLADDFSIERKKWTGNSFGFHGFFNFAYIVPEAIFNEKLTELHDDCFGNILSYDLVINLLKKNRFNDAMIVLSRRIKKSGWIKKNLRLYIFYYLKKTKFKLLKFMKFQF